MAQRTDVFDLGRLGLASGEGRRIDTHVAIEPLAYGGERYAAERGEAAVRLDVSRTTSGYSMRLRYEVTLSGPCVRCLTDAGATMHIDAREVDQPGGGEDLSSPYLEGEELDLRAWARDALALALPAKIVCREDCRGLCPVCGEDLNEAAPDHGHESAPDPRWSKLSELNFE
jgi:uncharacterized protein